MTATEIEQLRAENESLRARLTETEAILAAVQREEVDAPVMAGSEDDQERFLTLPGTDHPYRTLIEEMSEGTLIVTAAGIILYANRRLAEMLDVPPEKIIGSTIDAWLTSTDQGMVQSLLQTGLPESRPWRKELTLTDGDKEKAVYVSVNQLYLADTGEVYGLVINDLTEQSSHEAVTAPGKLAQTILDQVAEAVIVCDANGQIIRVNERAMHLCDQNPTGHMFQHIFDLEAAGETPFSLMEPAVRGQKRLEARLASKGEILNLLVSISPLLDEQRQWLGSVVVLTDITERKQIEKEILANQIEMERLLAEADQSRRALLSLVEDQQRVEAALKERLKEMACLYAVRRDMSLDLTTAELCRRIIEHLTVAMEFPELAVPVIELDGQQYASQRYHPDLDHGLAVPIVTGGQIRGALRVYYTEERPFLLPEEQELLAAIAEAFQLWLARQQAEEARQKSERLLHETQALSKIGGWEYDLVTEAITYTDEVHRILGVAPSFDLNDFDTALSFYDGPDRQRLEEAFMTAVSTDDPFELELQLTAGDGQRKWIFASGQPVVANGQPVKMVGYLMDITQRKQHEREQEAVVAVSAALRQAESRADMMPIILEQLLALLQAEGAALAIYDPAANSAVIEEARGNMSHGIGQHLPLAHSITGSVITERQPFVTSDIHQEPNLYQSDLFKDVQTAVCIPLLTQSYPIGAIWVSRQHEFGPSDLRLLTAIADMSANAIHRTRLYEQTQAQAEQITQIIHSIPDGVLLLDDQRRVLLANSAAQEFLRLLTDTDTTGNVLTHLGDQSLDQLLTSPPAGRWHDVSSNSQTFEVIAQPLASGPAASGWVLVLRDVTERRLVQQQLQQQERLAAIGQLAAGIAHDFNNLMAVIVLYTQLVSHSPGLSERDQERLATIKRQADHAARMIQQILDFSRRSVLERQVIDLRLLLKQQVELLKRTLPETIEISWQSERLEYLAEADPTRLQQAIMNLAINARDAMPDGGRLHLHLDRLTVNGEQKTVSLTLPAGEWFKLTISDTGIGIAAEHLDHLFEPFFTTKPPEQGTGLGLAQVHGIVAQHGGEITVASQVRQGTTFAIYLPALPETVDVAISLEAVDLPRGNDELLLVVEDNETLRAALVDYLQKWNYRPLQAANGEEALKVLAVQSQEIALIISDAVMPRMGGVKLFHTLRQQKNNIPLILMSGHPLEEDTVANLRAVGLHTWLSKPPDLTQLAQAIAAALAAR
jgi:two-component system, cell cycle sensor histidine kinase and response regulator CckA